MFVDLHIFIFEHCITSDRHSQMTWLRQSLLPLSTHVSTMQTLLSAVPSTSIKYNVCKLSCSCSHTQPLWTTLATVNSRITFKLACYSPPVNLLICACYYTNTPLHTLCGHLINFSSMFHDFPLNLVKDHSVPWLLQSGMDFFLISVFHTHIYTDVHVQDLL